MAFLPALGLVVTASYWEWLLASIGIGAVVYVIKEQTATGNLANSALLMQQSTASGQRQLEASLDLQEREAEIARRVEVATQRFLNGLSEGKQQVERQAQRNAEFRDQLEEERALLRRDREQLTQYETELQALFEQATKERALANEAMLQVRAGRTALDRDRVTLASAKEAHARQVALDKQALTIIAQQLSAKSQALLRASKE